jgi:imidazolonepropionase
MATLITNIKQLVNVREESKLLRGKELSVIPSIENAYLVIENGLIAEYGNMQNLKLQTSNLKQTIDATGQFILPCWCDSHTHLVFAAGREEEFVDKIRGISYEEIAAKGGGILNSAKKLNEMKEDELFDLAWSRLNELIKLGTGAIEIKSGYGLSVDGELKMLKVIKRLKERSPIPIRSTFLGAHTFPLEFKENHQGLY